MCCGTGASVAGRMYRHARTTNAAHAGCSTNTRNGACANHSASYRRGATALATHWTQTMAAMHRRRAHPASTPHTPHTAHRHTLVRARNPDTTHTRVCVCAHTRAHTHTHTCRHRRRRPDACVRSHSDTPHVTRPASPLDTPPRPSAPARRPPNSPRAARHRQPWSCLPKPGRRRWMHTLAAGATHAGCRHCTQRCAMRDNAPTG